MHKLILSSLFFYPFALLNMNSWVELPADLMVPAFFTIKKDSDMLGYRCRLMNRALVSKRFLATEQKFEENNTLQLKEYFCKDSTWAVEEFLTLFRYAKDRDKQLHLGKKAFEIIDSGHDKYPDTDLINKQIEQLRLLIRQGLDINYSRFIKLVDKSKLRASPSFSRLGLDNQLIVGVETLLLASRGQMELFCRFVNEADHLNKSRVLYAREYIKGGNKRSWKLLPCTELFYSSIVHTKPQKTQELMLQKGLPTIVIDDNNVLQNVLEGATTIINDLQQHNHPNGYDRVHQCVNFWSWPLEQSQEIILNGYDINIRGYKRNTLLHNILRKVNKMVIKGLWEPVYILTEQDVERNKAISPFYTKLYERAQFLLQNGINPNLQNIYGKTVLHLAVEGKVPVSFIELLLAYKADVNRADYIGNTPIHLAIAQSDKSILKVLLTQQINYDMGNFLHLSAYRYLPERFDFNRLMSGVDDIKNVINLGGSLFFGRWS